MQVKSHRRSKNKSLLPLGILHCDLVHAGVESAEGHLYFCTVLDENTNFCWIISLRRKSEPANLVLSLLKKSQRQLHADVYKLRTDGGSEFFGLKRYLESEGIVEQTSVPYDHAGNSRIESSNRRITERARTMLHGSNLPLSYCSFAVQYAAHLRNITTGAFKRLHGSEPALDKFIAFGAEVEVHVPKELLQKL
jgi:hypothetical protein